MRLKSLLVLIIAIAIGGTAYYLSSKPKNRLAGINSYLIPGFSEKLNDVTKLTILKAGNTLLAAISKSENSWIIENRNGYEADITVVRAVFNTLAEAKLIEAKTSKQENYLKLGVEDTINPNAQGVQFTIEGLKDSINIIAGKDASVGKNSQYVRRVGENQSWVINKKLNLRRDITQWLRKDILDVSPERIKSIQIEHIDGDIITIKNKSTKDYQFTLTNSLPEGKQISESEIYQVANALSFLQLRDVVSLDTLNIETIQSAVTTFVTFDGLTVTAKILNDKETTYSVFDVAFNADHVDETDSFTNPESPANEKFVKEIAPRLNGWAFVLPTITQEALIKKLENFTLAKDPD